jgi:chromosome segregation ATPase
MTNEELEELMNFIIIRQERMVSQQERTVEQQQEHDERLARFERSYAVLVKLLEKHDAQIIAVTTDGNKANRAIEDLATIAIRSDETVAGHDKQIAELRDSINNLTRTVDRYITSRGNNGDGGD